MLYDLDTKLKIEWDNLKKSGSKTLKMLRAICKDGVEF